jgi:hypothetical protein
MARAEADISRRHLANLVTQRASTMRSITEYENRLAAAHRSVAEHDRLLVRRRHRFELDGAHRQLEWIPKAIEQSKTKLAEIDNDAAKASARLIEASTINDRHPELQLEQTTIARQLDHDRSQHAERLATKTPTAIVDSLGQRPTDGARAALWDDAVGRLAQHHTAFGEPGGELVGRKPRLLGDEAYAASYWPTVKAIEHLDRALGREQEIEPLHQSLGLSL